MNTIAGSIYLAARYSRRLELCAYHQLDNAGIPITEDGERRFEAGDPAVNHLRAHFAVEDIADVIAAATVVAFTEEPRTCNSRGGRHVELGIALGAGKHVVVIGPRENVFCWLPDIEHYPDWPAFLAALAPTSLAGAR